MLQRLFRKKPEIKANPIGSLAVMFGLGQPAMMAQRPDAYAEEGYLKNAVVFACVDKIARACASVDLKLMREAGAEKLEIADHPLVDLLYRPNPLNGKAAFIEALVGHRLIAGNAYMVRSPDAMPNVPPNELWLLRPDRMKVLQGAGGMPQAYEYRALGGLKRFDVDPLNGTCDVMHWRSFNPASDWYGASAMAAAAQSVDSYNKSRRWNMALLDNSANPSGAFVMKDDGTLSDEQYRRLQEQIDREYTGAKNSGKPLLLEGGLDFKAMGLNPKDMDFNAGIWSAAREIAMAYGVPPMLIGIPGDSTFNNYREAKLAFWMDTVLPLFNHLLGELNHWLVPQFGDDTLCLYADNDSIPALELQAEIKAQRISKLKNDGILTINEAREALGYDRAEGGDMLMVSNSQIPLEIVGELDDEADGTPAAS